MDNRCAAVLLAEDNPALQKVTQFALQRAGLTVDVASDGQTALEMLRERRYGLLVTDQQMPRMSGVELVTALRELPEYAALPVVLLTAKAFELDHEKLTNELGIAEVLRKPFSPVEVSRLAQELLATPV